MPLTDDRPTTHTISSATNDLVPNELEAALCVVQVNEMGQPALLFLAGHRPLAFVLGQCLHALTPFASMVGWENCTQWATLLSHQDGTRLLEERLHDSIK